VVEYIYASEALEHQLNNNILSRPIVGSDESCDRAVKLVGS